METTTAYQRMFSSADACRLAGISYRQLDYWCRIGTVTSAVRASGSGSRRGWSAQQVAVLAVLARVGSHLPIRQLDELAALLLDWDVNAWGDTTLLVNADGVWHAGDAGTPAVAVAVNLQAILTEVRDRHRALA